MGTIQDLPASGEQLFARRSSGLVRAASTTDASLVNVYTATFPIMVSFLLGICLAVLRRCQPVPDDPDRALLAMPILLAYAVASSVVRRSGGGDRRHLRCRSHWRPGRGDAMVGS
ncbi:MAG TPA: hypothetical protein VLX31_11650 [Streptosporangiaceae bacterium]|nr:hypothetical protein [Streptosporangiaceae bacterium]